MSTFTRDQSVRPEPDRFFILKPSGERLPIVGVANEDQARRVFYGPWREDGDKLVCERTCATWQWEPEDDWSERQASNG